MARPAVRKRRVVAWVFDVAAYNAVFEPLRKRYPDIEFELRSRGSLGEDHTAVLMRELQAPWTPLSIFPIHLREMDSLFERGLLRNVDAALEPDVRARYAPTVVDLCSRNGKLYAVPEDFTPYSLMVRTDLLGRHNLQPPGTWAELERQMAWFVARGDGSLLRAQEGGPSHRYAFIVSLLGSNGLDFTRGLEHLAQNRAPLIAAYEWVRRMIRQRFMNYPADLYNEKKATQELFREGRYAYVLGWPSDLRSWPIQLAAKVRLLPFPRGPAGLPVCAAMNGSAWCVPHNTVSLDIAFEVLEAVSSPVLARQLELAGGMAFPAMKALWNDTDIRARKPYYRYAQAVTRCAHPYTPDFVNADLRRLEETFHQALQENLSGEDWLKRLASESHTLALRSVSDQIVRHAMAYIENNLADIHSVTQVAASVKRNPDHVNRLFRREVKQSCRTYLARRRMERARELLVDVTLSLKEIAARIGIRSAASFSRTCQQHWGCSAVQMRKRELQRIHGGGL